MACTRPVLALTALLGILSIPALASARWTRVAREGRVTVFVEEDAGRDVPRFKGVSVIDGTIPHIMAILSDADRACEWNRACVENRVLERSDGWHFVFYNRLRSPWPVSDRDAVMRSEVRVYDGGKRVVASFRALHRARPAAPSGVVRFERLYGHYELRAMPRRATLVSYVIDADPGGWVPGWVVRYVIRNVPIGTLQGLQRQVRRTAGKYRARIGAQRALFGRARAAPSSVGPVKHLDRRLTDPGAISTGRGGATFTGGAAPRKVWKDKPFQSFAPPAFACRSASASVMPRHGWRVRVGQHPRI